MSVGRAKRWVSLEEIGAVNSLYLATADTPDDPSLVWGSSFQTEALEAFSRAESLRSNSLITSTHVLLKAVAVSIGKHPSFNRRIVGRRVVQLDDVNIVIPVYLVARREVMVVRLEHVEAMDFREVSQALMREVCGHSREAVQDTVAQSPLRQKYRSLLRSASRFVRFKFSRLVFRIYNRIDLPFRTVKTAMKQAGVLVNVFNYPTAPPMLFFKPSCLRLNGCHVHVSVGPTTLQPVVENGEVVARRVATIFVRGDHRLVDTPQIASFMSTLRNLLQNPESIYQSDRGPSQLNNRRHVA